MMAQEVSEAPVASNTTSPGPNWWDVHIHAVPSSAAASWSQSMNPWQSQNPNSASSCEEDIAISATSFTNASSHSALTADTAATELPGEHVEHHIWRQVLLGVGSLADLRGTDDSGENFMEVLSSKNLPSEIPEPAFNYLKKLDNSSWGGFTSPTPFNNMGKHPTVINGRYMEHERLTNLSDLVTNWSIAPPDPHGIRQMSSPIACTSSLSTLMGRYVEPTFCNLKQGTPTLSSEPSLLRSIGGLSTMHQLGFSSPPVCVSRYESAATPEGPWSTTRNFSDLVSFGSCPSKPLIDFRGPKSSTKSSDSADSRKQGQEIAPSIRGSGSQPSVSSEGKKKRSEDNAESRLKKSKSDNSTSPSAKSQVPKVKLAERITALQQIVSPFGKTDTASVLLETINFIKYLHEQVQLLSDPYMKSGFSKDHSSWGGAERKEKQEPEVDLKSRGLCLVPVACTPQMYRENNGPDYWTPTYRGCLYR